MFAYETAVYFIKIYLYLNNKLNEFNNQSIGHRYIWLFLIFLVTGGFLPNTFEANYSSIQFLTSL